MRSTILFVLMSLASQAIHANERGCAIHEQKAHDCADCAANAPPQPEPKCDCERCRRVQRPPAVCVADRVAPPESHVPAMPGVAMAPQAAPGVFAAPPANGTVAGESNSIGINGPALHFPAMSLRLPSLQLPSFTRYRSGARMRIDAAEAPFVGAGHAPVVAAAPMAAMAAPMLAPQAVAMPTAAPIIPAAPQSAPSAAPCNSSNQAAPITPEELLQALQMIRESRQAAASPSNGATPNCSSNKDQAALDERIRLLEARERAVLDQMRRLDEALRRIPVSAPDDGDQAVAERPAPIRSLGPPLRLPEPVTNAKREIPLEEGLPPVTPHVAGTIHQTNYYTTVTGEMYSTQREPRPILRRLPPP